MPGMCEMRCSPSRQHGLLKCFWRATHMMWPLLALTSGQPRSEASIASRAADDFASSVLIDSFGLELAGSIAVVLQKRSCNRLLMVSRWGSFAETPVANAAALHSLRLPCAKH